MSLPSNHGRDVGLTEEKLFGDFPDGKETFKGNLAPEIAKMCLVRAWNAIRDSSLYGSSENSPNEVEFLRHIRRALAHDEILSFEEKHLKDGEKPRELKHQAEWNEIELDESYEGMTVINDLFNSGDVLKLLVDIRDIVRKDYEDEFIHK